MPVDRWRSPLSAGQGRYWAALSAEARRDEFARRVGAARQVGAPAGWTMTRACDDAGVLALRAAGLQRGAALAQARQDRIAIAHTLASGGLPLSEVAECCGVSPRTARAYLGEPDPYLAGMLG